MRPELNHSEITRLLDQIEAEYLAAERGLTGFAESASHAAITARMERIGRLHADLHALADAEAIRLMAERLATVPEDEEEPRCIV